MNVNVEMTDKNTKIYDAYKCKNIAGTIRQIMESRKESNRPVTRTFRSYISETRAHIRLYKLGLFRNHTKDVDLEENISRWEEIIWYILGV